MVEAKEKLAGKFVDCPGCHQAILIPRPETEAGRQQFTAEQQHRVDQIRGELDTAGEIDQRRKKLDLQAQRADSARTVARVLTGIVDALTICAILAVFIVWIVYFNEHITLATAWFTTLWTVAGTILQCTLLAGAAAGINLLADLQENSREDRASRESERHAFTGR